MTFTRGLGHIPDDPDPRDWVGIGRLVGVGIGTADARYADALDYRAFCADVTDQGSTNKCVGSAIVGAIDTQARLVGRVQPYGSDDAVYAIARALDAASPDAPLLDLGSKPRMAIRGVQRYGLVARERWQPADASERPPFDVFHAGSTATIASYTRIESDVVMQLAMALARGFIPIFAMSVDQSYLDWEGRGVYQGLRGPAIGRHMQAIVGYDLASPEPYFIVRNSWGAGWAEDGYARVAARVVASSDASDRYVMQSTPWPA
jgi:hypothetical protein